MKRSNSVYFSFAVMAVSLLLGHLNADAFDACRNVSFRFKNSTGRAIDIKKVKYYNLSEARWETENVRNGSERCNNGQTCELQREDLNGAENDRITKVKFIYKEVNSNIERESGQFEPTDPVCRADKIFGYGQNWTLTVAASTATSGNGMCNNVRFKFQNNTGTNIKITTVHYFLGGRWRTEAISGGVGDERAECRIGSTCTTYDVQSTFDNPNRDRPNHLFDVGGMIGATGVTNANYGSNLSDAAGADITQVKFEYKRWTRKTDWNGTPYYAWPDQKVMSQVFRPTSPRCSDDRIYGEGQAWTIGSGGQNTNSGASGTPTLTQSSNPATAQGVGAINAGVSPTSSRNGGSSQNSGGRGRNGQQTGTDPTGGGNDSASPNGGGRRKKGTKNSTEPNVDVVEDPATKPARNKRKGQKEKGANTQSTEPANDVKPANSTQSTDDTVKPKAKRRKKP